MSSEDLLRIVEQVNHSLTEPYTMRWMLAKPLTWDKDAFYYVDNPEIRKNSFECVSAAHKLYVELQKNEVEATIWQGNDEYSLFDKNAHYFVKAQRKILDATGRYPFVGAKHKPVFHHKKYTKNSYKKEKLKSSMKAHTQSPFQKTFKKSQQAL